MVACAFNKCKPGVNTSFTKCNVALVDDSPRLGNSNKLQIAKLLW